jgi:hypothetical protein
MFQCIIENTNPYADNLRDMEIVLFDWLEKDVALVQKESYPEKIENLTDIVQFFAYLHCDRKIVHRPDKRFDEYVNAETQEATFSKEDCARFDQLMNDAHRSCKAHKENIYELRMDVNAFFDGHVRLTDRKRIDAHYRDYIDPLREMVPDLVALHVYQGGYWIEEMELHGKPQFQMAFGDVSAASTNLRELEVDLFDSREDQFLRPRRVRRQ